MTTDPQRVRLIRASLDSLLGGVRQLTDKRSPHFEPGSLAEVEQSDPKFSQQIHNGCSMGSQSVESAFEHLSAFGKTITEPVEAIACWTNIRSMLEPCARAIWLFDPNIDIRERAARSFALQYEGLVQLLKFMRLSGRPQTEIDSTKQKIDDMEQKALSLGFAAVLSKPYGAKKPKRLGIGKQVPTATDLIQETLAKGALYSLLSAAAHSHFWAITALSFAKTAHPTITTHTGVKMATIQKHLNVTGVGTLAMAGLEVFASTVDTHFRYNGVDTAEVERLRQETALRLKEAVDGP